MREQRSSPDRNMQEYFDFWKSYGILVLPICMAQHRISRSSSRNYGMILSVRSISCIVGLIHSKLGGKRNEDLR